MNRQDCRDIEELRRVSCLSRSHREVISDGQQRESWLVYLANDAHIAKNVRIASVVNFIAVRKLQHVACRFTEVDGGVIFLRETTAMICRNHRRFHAAYRDGATLIDADGIVHPFPAEPSCNFDDGYDGWRMRLRQGDCVADVVRVPVRYQHQVKFIKGFERIGTYRVTHYPRIDEERLAVRLNFEGRMPQPRELNAVVQLQFKIPLSLASARYASEPPLGTTNIL